jgi:hypothetical protein
MSARASGGLESDGQIPGRLAEVGSGWHSVCLHFGMPYSGVLAWEFSLVSFVGHGTSAS